MGMQFVIMDILWELLIKVGLLSVFLLTFFYGLYKTFLWSRGKPKGAFVLFALLPLISFFPIPPPAFKNMENVEKKAYKRKEDSGEPPNKSEP